MIQRVCLTVIVSMVVSLASPAADRPANPVEVLRALKDDAAYELTLATPESKEVYRKQGTIGTRERLAFDCLSPDGHGSLTLSVRLTATDETFTVRSRGLADDFYLVRILGAEKSLAAWHKKAIADVKNSPDVVIAAPHKPSREAVQLDSVPGDLLTAVVLAATKYEEKRAELSVRARQEGSLLYFPPATQARWDLTRDGSRLFVRTGSVDKMYSASFEVELRKNGETGWEYVRLRGQEVFKGE